MNVTLIEMDQAQARKKLQEYRRKCHKDAENDYAAMARAYKELAEGFPLINIVGAIREGGVNDEGWPRFAIARADRKEIRFRWGQNQAIYDARHPNVITDWNWMNSQVDSQLIERVSYEGARHDGNSRFALVPMVPPHVRPEKGQLRDWYILWEVEHWSERSSFATVSPDPLLMKHVDGDLYAVIGAWDLTPLEESILNSIRH